MIISPYLITQFLAGTKTQHRIPFKPGDSLSWVEQRNGYALALPPDQPRLLRNDRLLYRVGGTYAIQPRGRQRAIAEVKILKITGEDVRTISQEEVEKEWYWVIDYTRLMGNLIFRGSEQFYEQPHDVAYRLRGLGVPPADTVWRLIETQAFNFEKCRLSSPSEELDGDDDEQE